MKAGSVTASASPVKQCSEYDPTKKSVVVEVGLSVVEFQILSVAVICKFSLLCKCL